MQFAMHLQVENDRVKQSVKSLDNMTDGLRQSLSNAGQFLLEVCNA